MSAGSAMRSLLICWRISETVLSLLALAARLPVAGALSLPGRLLNASKPFGTLHSALGRACHAARATASRAVQPWAD
jgi:hypothetical protein